MNNNPKCPQCENEMQPMVYFPEYRYGDNHVEPRAMCWRCEACDQEVCTDCDVPEGLPAVHVYGDEFLYSYVME